MRARSRYRVVDGCSCIDVRLRSARQLFDLRDPAPFRERDLEPAAAEYLMTCLREIPRRTPVRIVLFINEGDAALGETVLKDAIRGHFLHEREVVDGRLRENFRHGRHLFAIGVVVLAVFLFLSKATARMFEGVVQEILREGLVITGWVAMWRPAEVLLYDWWPLYDQRRWIDKLLASEVVVQNARASLIPDAPAPKALELS